MKNQLLAWLNIGWWNENKMWLAPLASLIMWAISMLCFVFGLNFKNPMGITIGRIDAGIVIAFSLSLAITIIQLIGSSQDDDMDPVMKLGWYSSYVLGISSNVNTLLGILGIPNPILEWAVALALGTMIEVMPEKLIIRWLKTMSKPTRSGQQPRTVSSPVNQPTYRPIQGQRPVPQGQAARPAQNRPAPRAEPVGDFWANRRAQGANEPTYHPVGMNSQSGGQSETYTRK